MSEPLKLAVLISGNGSNLQAIIEAIKVGINAEIAVVISSHEDAYGLTRAKNAGIPTVVITKNTPNDAYDSVILATVEKYQAELVILAGFMRIIGPLLTHAYRGRMINIHPSLLPKYRGLNTHQRVLDAGDQEHGISVHFVSEELDGGPIIARSRFEVNKDDTALSLQQKGHEIEHKLYPNVIHWIASGRLALIDNLVFLDGKPLTAAGYDFICDQDYEISEKGL